MSELPFRSDVIEWLADHRSPVLTPIFQFFTNLGDMPGFILIIVLIYVAYDKRLAVRLAVLSLVTMSINHVLKTAIHNPRPFMHDGSYRIRWAVSEARAADLATEFSTPSGHAMVSGAFYTYAYAMARNRLVRVLCVLCLVLIGLSRPYLGVHYVEDVLLGWLLGILIALLAVRGHRRIGQLWARVSYGQRVLLLLSASVALWLGTWAVSDWSTTPPPSAFISYAGLLTGILLGETLEQQFVDFDARGPIGFRVLLRYAMCVVLVLGTLSLLKVAFAAVAEDATPLGQALRYVRYAAAGLAGIFVAPLLFVRTGLATRARPIAR